MRSPSCPVPRPGTRRKRWRQKAPGVIGTRKLLHHDKVLAQERCEKKNRITWFGHKTFFTKQRVWGVAYFLKCRISSTWDPHVSQILMHTNAHLPYNTSSCAKLLSPKLIIWEGKKFFPLIWYKRDLFMPVSHTILQSQSLYLMSSLS